jgi:hypothetical protein
MNWLRLLDDQLSITKSKRYNGMIVDNNRSQILKDITNSIIPFGPEEFLSAVSLQGQEKLISFEDHIPFQEWNVLFFNDNESDLCRFSIRCYILMNPLLAEKREIHPMHNLGWIFYINKDNFTFKSKLLTILENDFVYFNTLNNKTNIKLVDKDISLNFKINNEKINIIWKNKTIEHKLELNRLSNSKSKNGITFHFENVYDEKIYSKLELISGSNDEFFDSSIVKSNIVFEHNIQKYRTDWLHRFIFNLRCIFNPKIEFRSVRFILFFNNSNDIILDIKQPEIDSVIFFIDSLISEIRCIDTEKDALVPEKWKLVSGVNKYYIVKNKSFEILDPIGSDILMEVNILRNNPDIGEIVGKGLITYHNWNNEKDIIRKINGLYPPLERPDCELFINQCIGSSNMLTNWIFIILFIILIISICVFITIG